MTAGPAAAVVLAGGAGRRLGGVDKPSLTKDGRSLLDRSLAAVGTCPTVVVGPPRDLPPWCRPTREDPPGAGPAAALAAGVALLSDLPRDSEVAVLAADLPAVRPALVARLLDALRSSAPTTAGDLVQGAVLVDPSGERQWLAGVWRLAGLRDALAQRPDWAHASLRGLLSPLVVIEVAGDAEDTADIDTPADLRRWSDGPYI